MQFKLLIGLLISLMIFELNAQVKEYTRHITRSFLTNSSMSVDISNKYGRVHIIPWDEDSVKFNIDLRIRAKDEQKLEKMKRYVEFDFTTGQSFLTARTKFGDAGSDVLKDIVDIAGSYLSSSNSVNINYTVWVPQYVSIKIDNKFGDIYFDDHNGAVNATLSYGDLKANRLNGRSEIKITSGDAEINYLKDGMITVSYANLHVREAARLTAQTQSSVITIDKSGLLKINSRRDKLYLNELNYVTGESYFSDINMGILNHSIIFSSRYGDLDIDNIQKSCHLVDLTSELTDIMLLFERPLNSSFHLTHHQSVIFTYPTTLAHLTSKVLNAEEKIMFTTGNFGAGGPDNRIIIKAPRKCSITISQR